LIARVGIAVGLRRKTIFLATPLQHGQSFVAQRSMVVLALGIWSFKVSNSSKTVTQFLLQRKYPLDAVGLVAI
jgi:hypothetical protein